jgi:hypothetical protein
MDPECFLGGEDSDPEDTHNLCLILKIILQNDVASITVT